MLELVSGRAQEMIFARPVAPDFALRRGCLHVMQCIHAPHRRKGTKGKVQVALRPPARESYPFQCSGLFKEQEEKKQRLPEIAFRMLRQTGPRPGEPGFAGADRTALDRPVEKPCLTGAAPARSHHWKWGAAHHA